MTSTQSGAVDEIVQVPQLPMKAIDAGLKGLDHYKQRLPAWRHKIREQLIPVVRSETPYLAALQRACRSSFLDSYFAMTANLGTHTFFMAALPVLYWCGYPTAGMAFIQMLGVGVYLSGTLKDALCLPRPLSPPLQRITMSGSAALEYGFPSTHTTNAVSVTIFCLYQLELNRSDLSDGAYYGYAALFWLYMVSISAGRLYCGMHGFFDVGVAAILGALIAWLRIAFGTVFDQWIIDTDLARLAIFGIVLLLAVRFHAEPADDCPCFDDSVSFVGVVLGIECGAWNYGQHLGKQFTAMTLADMYPYTNTNLVKSVARVLGGIVLVFVWRAIMKPSLLASLPPVFRFVDQWGLRLPRRYFLQARHYGKVPPLPKDDNVLPAASKISGMLTTLPNPRKRTVSVGPQSEADVREFIANREHRRRNSRSESITKRAEFNASGIELGSASETATKAIFDVPAIDIDEAAEEGREEARQDQRMFDALQRPRVRYDVEVITKLIVYTGIGWLVVEGNPRLFTFLGIA